MYFCSFVTKCNQAINHPSNIHQMYSCLYRTITHGEFHKIFTIPPPSLKWGFPTLHYRTSSFCCHHIFFSILIIFNSKLPPKDKYYFNRSWQASSHIFLLQTKFPFWSPIFSTTLEHPLKGTCSFNRP